MRSKALFYKFFTLIVFTLLSVSAAKAGVSPVTITSTIAAQSNTAVSTSGSVVTIDSDQLASDTGNLIAFDVSALTSSGAYYFIDGFAVVTTLPNAGPTPLSTPVDSIVSGGDQRAAVFTVSVDKVSSGGSTGPYTITLTAFTDEPGDLITSCSQADASAFNDCDIATITVNVTPVTTPSVNPSALTNNFVRRRARNILNAEPDLGDQLGDNTDDGEVSSVTYKATGSLKNYNATFSANTGSQLAGQGYGSGNSSANPFNLWIDGNVARSKEAGQRQDFAVSHFGVGYRANLDLIYGVMAQVDYAKEVNGSANVRGTGWLLGPYLAARLRDNLVFDGRIAYGQSDNKVSPIGTYIDQFDTTRFLIRGQLKGDIQHDTWTIAPTFGFNYIHEVQHAYTDSLNAVIPEAIIELGQIIFGTEFKTEILTDNGLIVTPKFGVKGLWNFKDTGFLDTVTNTVRTDLVGDLSARLDFGFGIANDNGLTLDFNGFFDGIGASNYEAYGATAKLAVKF